MENYETTMKNKTTKTCLLLLLVWAGNKMATMSFVDCLFHEHCNTPEVYTFYIPCCLWVAVRPNNSWLILL